MSILSEELEDLETDLENAKRKIANNPGPLNEPEATQVNDLLGSADQHRLAALDILEIEGTPTTVLPANLPAIAEHCRLLADQAYQSAISSNPNNQLIADRLATIQWAVSTDNGYKDLAGLA